MRAKELAEELLKNPELYVYIWTPQYSEEVLYPEGNDELPKVEVNKINILERYGEKYMKFGL